MPAKIFNLIKIIIKSVLNCVLNIAEHRVNVTETINYCQETLIHNFLDGWVPFLASASYHRKLPNGWGAALRTPNVDTPLNDAISVSTSDCCYKKVAGDR
jgi:hypothetical protein